MGLGLGNCNYLIRMRLLCPKERVHWTGQHRLLDSTTGMVMLCPKERGHRARVMGRVRVGGVMVMLCPKERGLKKQRERKRSSPPDEGEKLGP